MKKSQETILNLKFFDEEGKHILKQKVQIVYEDGSTELVWREVEGQEIPVEPSFSDRFKHDTFQPHPSKDVKTDTITKKIKLDVNFNQEKMTPETMMKHIERSVRVDNLMKKLLNEPKIIKENGFDFKGNDELKKAMKLICIELGGEWADVPSFFK